jgi:hypothetical protein
LFRGGGGLSCRIYSARRALFASAPFLPLSRRFPGFSSPSSLKVWRHATVRLVMANSPGSPRLHTYAPWLGLTLTWRWHGPLAAEGLQHSRVAPRPSLVDSCKLTRGSSRWRPASARFTVEANHGPKTYSIGLALEPARPQEALFVLFAPANSQLPLLFAVVQDTISFSVHMGSLASKSRQHQVREATSEWSTLWLSTELNCPIVFCYRCFLSDLRFCCR